MSNLTEEEVFIRIVLAFSKMVFDDYNSTIMIAAEKALTKELNKLSLSMPAENLQLALVKTLKYLKDRNNQDLTTEEIIKYITLTIKEHKLEDQYGSSLLADTISSLISMKYSKQICPTLIDMIMQDEVRGYKEKQEERRQAFREYYNLNKKTKEKKDE